MQAEMKNAVKLEEGINIDPELAEKIRNLL
jgi:hypothetical protein